ncbi:hypothetical protein [Streptomyces sp. N50]|uniref:hypothetical protein n=1 Tax=Streptomyces sp. N50 TaxID=3081765 RepID=UPI0029621913|nr:hypothetical protein [Streptomyces sp. N50]WOX10770.1 hypothetical protein R2B38_18860 [Streptomyces sp. N50]
MGQDIDLEKIRARYGLLAVVGSNIAITAVAVFGVWQLNGDRAVIVGVLTSAFTAMAGLTTAYLGIKAVSNTAQSMSKEAGRQQDAERQQSARPAPEDEAVQADGGPGAESPGAATVPSPSTPTTAP